MNGDTKNSGGGTQHYVIVAVIAFALGLGAGWMWAAKKYENGTGSTTTPKTVTTASSTTPTKSTTGGNDTTTSGIQVQTGAIARNTIVAVDQPAGMVVQTKVSTEQVVWAVIHEDSGEGEPAKILGAQLVDVGTSDVPVELLRGTVEGQTYYAMLHADNGDNAFDPKLDKPLTGADGQPVMSKFKATAANTGTTPQNF